MTQKNVYINYFNIVCYIILNLLVLWVFIPLLSGMILSTTNNNTKISYNNK